MTTIFLIHFRKKIINNNRFSANNENGEFNWLSFFLVFTCNIGHIHFFLKSDQLYLYVRTYENKINIVRK